MNFRLVDLTHQISQDMPVYPGDKSPRFNLLYNHDNDGFLETELVLSTHTGTHIDCPEHFFKGKGSTQSMALNSFFGKAVLIDCTNLKDKISLSVITKQKNRLTGAGFVLFYTGYDKWWGNAQYFTGFPVLSDDAAQYILSLGIKGIGLDTISADRIEPGNFPVHRLMLQNNVIIIENLKGLSQLPDSGFYFSCFPLKIIGGDGSPVRAVAYVPEK